MYWGPAWAPATSAPRSGCTCRAPSTTTRASPSGCATPVPVQPSGSDGEWTTWNGPYVARGFGYGFIGPNEQTGYGPALPVVAVDDEGHVLWFTAAVQVGSNSDGTGLRFAPGLEPWRPIVAPLLEDRFLVSYGRPEAVLVTNLRTQTLPAEQRDAVLAALSHGLATAREPKQNEGAMVADGGATPLVAGSQRVLLDDNHDRGSGWGEVEDQMVFLLRWIEPKD